MLTIPNLVFVCCMHYGYEEGIMVTAGVVWTVQHYINFKDIWIEIAVDMVNVSSLQMGCFHNQLIEPLPFQHLSNFISSLVDEAQIQISTNYSWGYLVYV